MNNPRVLVGCPTSYHKEYCLKEYAKAVNSLTYDNYDVLIVDNSKDNKYFDKIKNVGLKVVKGPYFEGARDRIIASRNLLRNYALEKSYDYFFSLEQDVIPPKNVIERMLSHNKEVISGIYFVHNILEGVRKLIPLVYVVCDDEEEELPSMRPLTEKELWSNKLLKVVSVGLGCVIIKNNVLKKAKFRYDKNTKAFDDRWFFIDLYNLNQEVFADTSIKCKHLILNRPFPWDKIKK